MGWVKLEHSKVIKQNLSRINEMKQQVRNQIQSKLKYKVHQRLTKEELNNLKLHCHKYIGIMRQNIADLKFEKTLTTEINDPYIYKIEHSFTDEECDSMLQQFESESCYHYSGVTGGGYTPNTKRTREINITRTSSWVKWNKLCYDRLNQALYQYANHCLNKCNNNILINILTSSNLIINDTGYQLQKYKKECEYYKWHQDGGLKKDAHEHRIITYLWYLNDVEEGGETYFFNGKVKPTKGTLVLFPAFWNYNHKGETPISNDKYIITGWVYSNV